MASWPRKTARFGSGRCLGGCGHRGGTTYRAVGGTASAPATVSASQWPVGVPCCVGRACYRRGEAAVLQQVLGRMSFV